MNVLQLLNIKLGNCKGSLQVNLVSRLLLYAPTSLEKRPWFKLVTCLFWEITTRPARGGEAGGGGKIPEARTA